MSDKFSESVRIRMTKKLKVELQFKADAAAIKLSKFCREVLSGYEVTTPPQKEYLPSKVDEKVASDLTRIGNLLKLAIAKDASNRSALTPLITKLNDIANKIKV